jgi:hypothetical protein
MSKQVNYSLEMANTWEDLYAHVELEGVDIGPGDAVKLHQVPYDLPYGQVRHVSGKASYFKASAFKRWFITTFSRFEITMLYEVSFSSTRFSKQRARELTLQKKSI